MVILCRSRVPSSLLRVGSVLALAPLVGFSGSRSVVPQLALCGVLPFVPAGVPVHVGCARGVDSWVRSFVPGAVVFSAAAWGSGAASFARRSSALVGSLVSGGGTLVAFPGCGCPVGLVPCGSWPWGVGSGSWGSVALAVGRGVPVLLWLPVGVVPPCGGRSGRFPFLPAWGFEPLGSGWFFSRGSGR